MKTKGHCQAWSAASCYRSEHRCEKRANTRVVKVDGHERVICPHHDSLLKRRPAGLRFGPTPVELPLNFDAPRWRVEQRFG